MYVFARAEGKPSDKSHHRRINQGPLKDFYKTCLVLFLWDIYVCVCVCVCVCLFVCVWLFIPCFDDPHLDSPRHRYTVYYLGIIIIIILEFKWALLICCIEYLYMKPLSFLSTVFVLLFYSRQCFCRHITNLIYSHRAACTVEALYSLILFYSIQLFISMCRLNSSFH